MTAIPLPRLLIVDDEVAQMKALCQTLECEGYSVSGFTSAKEAVETLREQPFDLVLSDLMMAEMDGITLMRVALEIDPNLVGIVMTGYGTIDTAVQAMQQGAHDYILKPFKLSAILPVLTRALGVRRLRLENIQLHEAVEIYKLSMAIAQARDSGTVLQQVADAAFRQKGARTVSVLLPARNGEELKVAASRGDNAEYIQGACVPLSEELSGWLGHSRELMSRQGEFVDAPPFFGAPLPGFPSGISVPMLAGGKLIGILHVGQEDAQLPIAPGQLKSLNILAATAASAIQGTLLLEEVRAAEERYRRLSENAPDIVSRYEVHPQRRFAYVSPVVAAISGYSPEEHYADPELGLKVVHPDDRALLESVLRGDRPSGSTITLRWLHKNGNVIWIEQKNVLVQDPDGRLVAIEGIARDTTDRRKLEEQFQQAQRLEGVGRLAGGVAHDFNNMLTVINGYTQMVLNELPPDHRLREDLEEVRMAGERAAALTQQLLAFSRKQLVNPAVLNINTAVLQMEKMLQRLIGEDIHLRTNLAPDLGNVLADFGQLQQVVMNLVVNSRDAMPDGGTVLIKTSNAGINETYVPDHRDVHQGRYVMLAVTDSGTGMTPEVQARLFEPFFTTKPQGVGTGLGLATVYGIVKQSGGSISVCSEPRRGTTFTVYLPRIDAGVVKAKLESEPAPASLRGTETILVVEDQDQLRKMAARVLRGYGYRVLEAANPGEALLSYCEHYAGPIHLLLTDVVMPGMTGAELASRIKPLRPAMEIVFMSGYSERVTTDRLELTGSYLPKPFSPETLATRVRSVLDSSRAAGSIR